MLAGGWHSSTVTSSLLSAQATYITSQGLEKGGASSITSLSPHSEEKQMDTKSLEKSGRALDYDPADELLS